MRDAPPNAPIDAQLKERIKAALLHLSPEEREVVSDRFGLVSGTPMTLETIRRRHGVDLQRLRQLEAEVLRLVREPQVE